MTTRRLVVCLSIALVASFPSVSWGHGDIESTDPKDGARLELAPDRVRISFSQAPTVDSRFEVTDGCGENILAAVGGEGPNAELAVEQGEPGQWSVSYRVISSVDGHLTKGTFKFRVAGKRDCSRPGPTATSGAGAPDAGPPSGDGDPGGSFPLVPVAVGGAVIVGLAVAARMFSSR